MGYVKKNFLARREFIDFSAVQPAVQLWVDTVADVRVRGATQRPPVDMFEEERAHLERLNPVVFDLARVCTVSVNKQFRVALDSCTYWRVRTPRGPAPDARGQGRSRMHLRHILALAERHGSEAVVRAFDDGLEPAAFSAEYIAHILAERPSARWAAAGPSPDLKAACGSGKPWPFAAHHRRKAV